MTKHFAIDFEINEGPPAKRGQLVLNIYDASEKDVKNIKAPKKEHAAPAYLSSSPEENTLNAYLIPLSKEECQVLIEILASVGGDPKDTQRKYADSIYEKLRELGFKYTKSAERRQLISGSINFLK